MINHPLWTKNLSLPVVDHGGILLGVLSAAALKAHIPGSPSARTNDVLAPALAIAELYWAASSTIIETISKKKAAQAKGT